MNLWNILWALLSVIFLWFALADLVAGIRLRFGPLLVRAVSYVVLASVFALKLAGLNTVWIVPLSLVMFVPPLITNYWRVTAYLEYYGLTENRLLAFQKPHSDVHQE